MSYHHAYLYAGPQGSGKHAAVEKIIRELVPVGYELDVLRLTDLSIEETRKIRGWVSLRPTGQHKVVVIDHADQLGGEAANNLLKVLEEPPAYAHFFLISDKPGQVMETITSRCERMDFHLPTDQQLPTLTKNALELAGVLKKGVSEKINYAKKLADDDQALETVTLLLRHVHAQLAQKPHLASVASGLLDLSAVLCEPQYNRRLAIEHFLLTCHVEDSSRG